jgi:hypothetical protein
MRRNATILVLAPLVIPLTLLGCSKVAETPTGPTAPSLTVDYTGSTSRALANARPEPIEIPAAAREAPPTHEARSPSPTPLERAVRDESHVIEAADLQALDLERLAAERDREEEAREAERRAALRAHPVVY